MDIFREPKVHATKDGSNHKPLCGASANGVMRTVRNSSSGQVTCGRCLRLIDTQGNGKKLAK